MSAPGRRRLGPGVTAWRIDRVDIHQPAAPMSVPRLPVRLAPRPTFLVGREELLAELGTRLANGDGAGPRTVALSGMGGTGKTSVAVEYAHRHLAEVEVAWQFPAEDLVVLEAEFGELAAQLGARTRPTPRTRWRRCTPCSPGSRPSGC